MARIVGLVSFPGTFPMVVQNFILEYVGYFQTPKWIGDWDSGGAAETSHGWCLLGCVGCRSPTLPPPLPGCVRTSHTAHVCNSHAVPYTFRMCLVRSPLPPVHAAEICGEVCFGITHTMLEHTHMNTVLLVSILVWEENPTKKKT